MFAIDLEYLTNVNDMFAINLEDLTYVNKMFAINDLQGYVYDWGGCQDSRDTQPAVHAHMTELVFHLQHGLFMQCLGRVVAVDASCMRT